MSKVIFNSSFFILNVLIYLASVFIFPNFKTVESGLLTQFMQVGFLLSILVLGEVNIARPVLKKYFAAFFLTLSLYYLLDSFSLYRSSYHFLDLVRIAFLGGDIMTTLKEVGIPPIVAISLLLVPILVIQINAIVYQKLSKSSIISNPLGFRTANFLPIGLLFLFQIFFIGEQILSKDQDSITLRKYKLPLYFQVDSGIGIMFKVSGSFNENTIQQALSDIGIATNPKNILMIILEGVPRDMIDANSAPFLHSLQMENGLPNSYTEAISTHLALNTLLFNRPPYTFEEDLKHSLEITSAALPFEIYKKSGYEIYLGVSTDFSMKNDELRALGKKNTVGHYFKGFTGEYVGRNVTDAATTKQIMEWINSHSADKPFLIVAQLDCTHWPYEFDRENAVFKPYLEFDRLDKFDNPQNTELVINRYKNSLRQLDHNISRIFETLTKKGLNEKTAVVIISDHGENFRKSYVTHLNLANGSKSILNIVSLPGKKIESTGGIVTHRDIWPTLFDYTGIAFKKDSNWFSGTSLLNKNFDRTSFFSVNGNLRQAELTMEDKIIHFEMQSHGNELFLKPYMATDRDGKLLPGWKKEIEESNWEPKIRKLIY